ncbi:MAG TPA: diguanylate cyclase [Tepidisphaeraceae bacterium]|jgi:diguanylate cyclase (GGDEF)-like protein|nr:diguanylate cyclase [Tepidisphaeraceae bacterium]
MAQRVLLIDDCYTIHGLIKARLKDQRLEWHGTFDGKQAVETAASILPDLILLDVDLPEMDGFEVCRRLKDDPRTMDIPVVFLTGATSTEEKIRGLELGAVDYIAKPFDPAELRARVKVSLRTKLLTDLLTTRAMVDAVTGLWNRDYFDARLTAETAIAADEQHDLACILIDIDRFRNVNVEYGHAFGNEILRDVAQLLLETLAPQDVISRYCGGQFAVICPTTSGEEAHATADRVREAIEHHTWTRGAMPVHVTCSAGVSDLHGAPASTNLIELSQAALSRAKAAGRNRVEAAA